jgi:hypothetical protein
MATRMFCDQDSHVNNTTLDDLLRTNAARLAEFRVRPFFQVLEDGSLADDRKRRMLLACIQRFSSNFQSLLFIRQGLCVDPRFREFFRKHLAEEIGHDTLLSSGSTITEPVYDPIFEAILGWFNYQMVALDNADRSALMHLVLEEAGDYFHTAAAAKMRPYTNSPYFEAHAELDAGHAAMGAELLQGESSTTYERLKLVTAQGWDMMDAIVERTRQLMNGG